MSENLTPQQIREKWWRDDAAAAKAAAEARAARRREQRREQNAHWADAITEASALGLDVVKVVDWHNESGTGFAKVLIVLPDGEIAADASVYIDRRQVWTFGTIKVGTYLRCRVGSTQPGRSCPQIESIEIFKD